MLNSFEQTVLKHAFRSHIELETDKEYKAALEKAKFLVENANDFYLALNALRLARKESSQAFNKTSYGQFVQSVFDKLEAETKEQS